MSGPDCDHCGEHSFSCPCDKQGEKNYEELKEYFRTFLFIAKHTEYGDVEKVMPILTKIYRRIADGESAKEPKNK